MDTSKLPGGNASFPSTGDPEKDLKIAADIRLRAGREAEGLCMNGCGPITIDSATDHHCDICGFVRHIASRPIDGYSGRAT